jgi:hypothetical protein
MTDLGQANGLFPDEGLRCFGEKLLESGFSEKEIRILIVNNPSSLIQ